MLKELVQTDIFSLLFKDLNQLLGLNIALGMNILYKHSKYYSKSISKIIIQCFLCGRSLPYSILNS